MYSFSHGWIHRCSAIFWAGMPALGPPVHLTPLASLSCPRPWGFLLPSLLPLFHRVPPSATPWRWCMGRLSFSKYVLFLSHLVAIWAGYRLPDWKSLSLRTMMTFAPLSSGFTVTVGNLDAILCVWSVSFPLRKLGGFIFGGGLMLWNFPVMVELFHSLFWIFSGPFSLEPRVLKFWNLSSILSWIISSPLCDLFSLFWNSC